MDTAPGGSAGRDWPGVLDAVSSVYMNVRVMYGRPNIYEKCTMCFRTEKVPISCVEARSGSVMLLS